MRGAVASALAAFALAVTGCAASPRPTASDEPSRVSAAPGSARPENEQPHEELRIEIEGDRVRPNGLRVQASAGEPTVLRVESDRAAELHVHSSPEQLLRVQKGTSRLEIVVEVPGTVDVEEHESGVVVLQLEVR